MDISASENVRPRLHSNDPKRIENLLFWGKYRVCREAWDAQVMMMDTKRESPCRSERRERESRCERERECDVSVLKWDLLSGSFYRLTDG